MIDRRAFIKAGTIGASVFSISGLAVACSDGQRTATVINKPIVISTWDFGVAANQAAWTILKGGGRALDAVEAGVRVPEADLSNLTVGKGGYPDRDGHVTLDACIMDDKGNCGSVAALETISHPLSVAQIGSRLGGGKGW